ncbi:FecR domain-containing protein [Prolixibacteraceae bacterium Z1-6]|uniref:FecR domain-containing protein n=1 Tax=Draconibacterium aestuarii TaxID=2998507 RepID=A0A9X3J681_9BACT|nr:FecR domain-containing protein [Prolixibacteraceae bacterium Z1-6]
MNIEILIKYLNNKCSTAELNEVISWAKEQDLDEDEQNQIIAAWKNTSEKDEVDDYRLSLIFDKIQQKTSSDNSKIIQDGELNPKRAKFLAVLTKVAAVLLIPVLLLFSYTLSERSKIASDYEDIVIDSLEIVAPWGSRTVVQLSDGSVIHLNSGSKIKYPQAFTSDKREVLLNGEAFFEVAHNAQMPFIVKTGDVHVTALGTSFNVFAYSDAKFIETTLVDGKVLLENTPDYKKIGVMTPGEHMKYNKKEGTAISSMGKVEKYISWIEGKIIFEDTPITEVAERLSRMFNVDIVVSDAIKNYNYTVTIIDEPLYQILDLMALATPIKYTVFKRKKNADGIYSKQKIILNKRK